MSDMTVSMKFTLTGDAKAGVESIEKAFQNLQKTVTQVNGQLASFSGTSIGAEVTAAVKAQTKATQEANVAAEEAYRLQLQLNSAKMSGSLAIRQAAEEQAIIEKRDMELQRQRWAEEADARGAMKLKEIEQMASQRAAMLELQATQLAAYREREAAAQRAAQALFNGVAAQKAATVETVATAAAASDLSKGELLLQRIMTQNNLSRVEGLAALKAINAELYAEVAAMEASAVATAEDTVAQVAHAGATKVNALAMKESVVLAREFSRGDISRMAGSATILLQSFGKLGLLFSPITALLAAVAGLGFAAEKSVEKFNALNNAIRLTGNYSNVSAEQAADLAKQMAETGRISITASEQVVQALVSSGRLGNKVLTELAGMAAEYAQATGQDVTKAADSMVKIFEKPYEGALKLNEAWHFLSLAQVEHIRLLEKEGDLQGAQVVLADALNVRLREQVDHLGLLGQALRSVKDDFLGAYDAAGKFFGKLLRDDTTTEKLAAAKEQLAQFFAHGGNPEDVRNAQIKVNFLTEQLKMETEVAAKKAEQSKLDEKAVALHKEVLPLYNKEGVTATYDAEIKGLQDVIAEYEKLSTTLKGKAADDNAASLAVARADLAAVERKRAQVLRNQADKNEDKIDAALAAANYEVQKNDFKNYKAVMQKLRDDGRISHEEYLKDILEAEQAFTAAEIKELHKQRDAELDRGDVIKAIAIQARIDMLTNDAAVAQSTAGLGAAGKKDSTTDLKDQMAQLNASRAQLHEQLASIKTDQSLTSSERSQKEVDLAKQEAALIRERIVDLRTLKSDDAEFNAQLDRTIADLNKQAITLAATQTQVQRQLMQVAQTGFEGFFMMLGKKGVTAKQIFDSLFQSILQGIEKILAQNLAEKLTKSLFPGTGTAGDKGLGMLGSLITGAIFGGGSGTSGFSFNEGTGVMTNADGWGTFAGVGGGGVDPALTTGYAVGTDYVPRDMFAKIHQGERILTAQENKDFSKGGSRATVIQNISLNEPTNTRSQSQIGAAAYRGASNAARRNN